MRTLSSIPMALLAGLLFLSSPSPLTAAEVFEVNASRLAELPGGKEADGIVGDFVIRNGKVEATISGNLPLRRANMSTFYGDGGETPGCLYDLSRRGEANDQITIFCPSQQKGAVSYVRIAEKGEDRVAVETVVSAARSKDGIARRHLYILEDGWNGVLIVSTLENGSDSEKSVKVGDLWTRFRESGSHKGITWGDSIDPSHKCGYAYGWIEEEGATLPKQGDLTLRSGEEVTVARFLAVGRSPGEAVGLVQARRSPGEVGTLTVRLRDGQGNPVAGGRLAFATGDEKRIPAYPDDEGRVSLPLPAGGHSFVVEDTGRDSFEETISVAVGGEVEKEIELGPQAAVQFAVTAEDGSDLPCKVQFHARRGTDRVNLGPTDRAHGCVDQWHSETGHFRVPLPPGEYRIVVTRGPEYDHLQDDIVLDPGATVEVAGVLRRSVSTSGWVGTDFHNHSTPSGDNTCGTDDRVINLAAEHIEFAPTTEHNRLYDWKPHIEKLGLTAFLSTIPGIELTGRGAHLNAFPYEPEPGKQDGGAPVWQKDPRLNAIVLKDYQRSEPDRWIQVNHPDMVENFVDRDGDGRVDGGFAYFGGLIDAIESQNYRESNILAGAPFKIGQARTGLGRQVNVFREFVWLQLLNQGIPIWGVAVADAHHVHGNGAGGWRTYVRSSTDDPAAIDWREIVRHAKAGRMILSTGPFLEVSTGSGVEAGGHDRVTGEVELRVKVQCSDWLDIDRVQVLVNGRQAPEANFTRETHPEMFGDGVVKFDRSITLDLDEDAHLIVVAVGEKHTLQKGFGTSAQASIKPVAYNNPIFVDVDGGGFEPNHDTLGYDLPVKGLTVDEVEALLGR